MQGTKKKEKKKKNEQKRHFHQCLMQEHLILSWGGGCFKTHNKCPQHVKFTAEENLIGLCQHHH